MAEHANRFYCYFINHRLRIFLCFVWLLGLLLGSWICLDLKPYFLPLMRSALMQPVSIVGLFVTVFLPLILTDFSVLCDKPIIILIVCFFKAVAYSFSGVLISQYWGAASWLVRFLFLFTDSFFTAALFILWFRRLGYGKIVGFADLYVCAALATFIAAADYFVISPFLMGIIS